MDQTIGSKVMAGDKKTKALLKRNMILLLLGQFVSLFGSSIYNFATGLYILQITGSGLNFAVSVALGSLPRVLFGSIAGVAADRFDRKKMVVYLDILSGLVVMGLLAVSLLDNLRVSYIYIATFLLTTCNTFFTTPLSSAIPDIVDDESLTRVNSLNQMVQSISSIAGPSVGGMIFVLIDIRLFLLFNGLSFILSGISEAFIDFNFNNKLKKKDTKDSKTNIEDVRKESFVESFKVGINYITSQSWLLTLSAFIVLLNLLTMVGLTIPVPYIVNRLWGFTSQQYGLLTMTFPIGMLIGSLVLSVMPEAKSNFKRLIKCLMIVSATIIAVGIITSEALLTLQNGYYLVILMLLYAIMSISLIFINVPFNVTMQRLVPNDKRGRVFGTLGTASAALTPLGAILGGVLVDKISPWLLPISCGVIMLMLTFLMYNTKELKNI